MLAAGSTDKFYRLTVLFAFAIQSSTGTLKMRDMKMQDRKMRHKAEGGGNATLENVAQRCRAGKYRN